MAEMGRPTDYEDAFAGQAKKLTALGATDVEIADFFGVHVATIYRWKHTHPDFCEALNEGKAKADERVTNSLYQKAVGYTFESEKIFQAQGEIIRAPTREHVPPDTTAAIFWLKNRQPELWRDKQSLEHVGKDGGPIETTTVSARDRKKAIAMLLERAKREKA